MTIMRNYFILYLIIISILIYPFFTLTIYYQCELSCVDDYINSISYSEGEKEPINPNHQDRRDRDDYEYIFKFDIIKHNLDQKLCIKLINTEEGGEFSFMKAYINEYDITALGNYENYYECINCNNNFKKSKEKKCNGKPIIITSNEKSDNYICLKETNDITIFFINEKKINQKFYKGNYKQIILSKENNKFYIDELFTLNDYDNLFYFLDSVSLKVVRIFYKKGKILNGNEELNEGSFFNAKNKYLTHIKENNEGYEMIITIETKVRNQNIDISTCKQNAVIHLFVSQTNCTMSVISNNYCQKCNPNYGKKDSFCYYKSEKFSNLYYDQSTQTWKKCETTKNSYKCSICQKGTYIKNSINQICEKCPLGEYNNYEDKKKCEKCPKGYYSNILGATSCQKCKDGYFSFPGSSECYIFCELENNGIKDIIICYADKTKNKKISFESKILKFFLNDNINDFNINCIFDNCNLNLNDFSFKIVKIMNKKGRLFNGDEEIFEDNIFYAKNKYLTYKNENDKGHLMYFYIEAKSKNNQLSYTETNAVIFLYFSQKNCTMSEISNSNYCQGCQLDFGKKDSNCYYKTEKFTNLYFDNLTQIWKDCELSNNYFKCSICPEGTYIKDSLLQICEKCQFGEYSNAEDNNNCEKCPRNYYSNILGTIACQKCNEGYISFPGSDKCFYDCQPGYFPIENECFPCQLGLYSPGSLDKCLDCSFEIDTNINYTIDFFPTLFENSTSFEKYKEKKYSLSGFSKCLPCGEIIPHCNNCTNEVICLECNNKAISGFGNCTICENTYDWIYTGEFCEMVTVCPKYFYKDKKNNSKIYCVDNIDECPEGMDYLNLVLKECKENISNKELLSSTYQIKEKKNEQLTNKISEIVINEYKESPEFVSEYLKNNTIQVKGNNSNLQFGIEENMKKANYLNIGIDFGNCIENILSNYSINNINDLILKVLELFFNETRIVKYYFYNIKDLNNPLDLLYCKDQIITIFSPPINSTEYFQKDEFNEWYEFLKLGKDILNPYSRIYTDPCFSFSILDKVDLTLTYRREYISKMKIPLCEEECDYEDLNLETFQVICHCPIKIDMDQEPNLSKFKNSFSDIKNGSNFEVLSCYKLVFNHKERINSIFSQIFILLFIINLTLIIVNEISIQKNLNNLINYCYEFINNNKDKKFKKIKKIFLKLKRNKEYDDDEVYKMKRSFKEKLLNAPLKRNINNEISLNENINDYNLFDNNEYKYYYFLLIYCYKKERKNFLIEEELNNLDYMFYRNIEDRKWYEIYMSIFKTNYLFTSTFFIFNNMDKYRDYKFYTIKIIIYLNCIILSIVINITFYNDERMYKIYQNKGVYNLLYNLPAIITSDLAMYLTSIFFEWLIDYQKQLIELKINLNNNISKLRNKKKMNHSSINSNKSNTKVIKIETKLTNSDIDVDNSEKRLYDDNKEKDLKKIYKENIIKKQFRINLYIFNILTIILNVMSWYYVSCFCAVYINTEKHIFFDFYYRIFISLGICLLACLINTFIRIIIIKGDICPIKTYILKIINFENILVVKVVIYLIIILINK